jgi:hypothetical protein
VRGDRWAACDLCFISRDGLVLDTKLRRVALQGIVIGVRWDYTICVLDDGHGVRWGLMLRGQIKHDKSGLPD